MFVFKVHCKVREFCLEELEYNRDIYVYAETTQEAEMKARQTLTYKDVEHARFCEVIAAVAVAVSPEEAMKK